jgi:hypothetical protein
MVSSFSAEEYENERFTVLVEWELVRDDYARRYPSLVLDDFLAVLDLPVAERSTEEEGI